MDVRILIVEDEFPIALDIKTRLIAAKYNDVAIAGSYNDAVKEIKKKTPDLAILDINLSGNKSGIDLAHLIKNGYNFPIIFLTAYSTESTLEEALEANPMGYITKPFKDIDLHNNIKLSLKKFHDVPLVPSSSITDKKGSDYIFIKEKGGIQRVDIHEILWLEAMDNYTIIHLKNKKHIVNTFLKDVLLKLGNGFIRVHRSHAIALAEITSLQDNLVSIGPKELIVSQSYKSLLLAKLNIL